MTRRGGEIQSVGNAKQKTVEAPEGEREIEIERDYGSTTAKLNGRNVCVWGRVGIM